MPELLTFIETCLGPQNNHFTPRDDYRESLELAKLVLGGRSSIQRKRGHVYRIQRPGADHHARWMSKAICVLKLTLLLPQFPTLPSFRKKQLEKMSYFIVFVHLRSWFTAPLLYSAARFDLELYKRIRKFSKVIKKLSAVGKAVLQRHTWYLTEELIPLSLFDTKLPDETLNLLAQKIAQLPNGDIIIKKPTLPKIRSTLAIPDFVGPRSTVLFEARGVSQSFLALSNWRDQPEYHQVKTAIRNFTPLNDCSERVLALATTLCGVVIQDQILPPKSHLGG